VSWGYKIPTFRGNLLSTGLSFEMSSSRTYRGLKTRTACCCQIPVYDYQFTYSHVQKKGNLKYTESKKKKKKLKNYKIIFNKTHQTHVKFHHLLPALTRIFELSFFITK